MGTLQKVETLRELYELVQSKRSVWVPRAACFNKPRPAAFVINLSGSVLIDLFATGMYVYEANNKKRKVKL